MRLRPSRTPRIFIVAAYTGLRLGELRALRWRDLDFEKLLVHVRRNLPAHGGERVPKSGLVRSGRSSIAPQLPWTA